MTALIGIVASDGVVVAADSSATSVAGTMPLIEQPTTKIEIVGGNVIVAGTGSVGLGQRFIDIVKRCQNWEAPTAQLMSSWNFKTRWTDATTRERADMLSALSIVEFQRTMAYSSNGTGFSPRGGYGALVAFPGDHLVEYDPVLFQPEFKEPKKQNWFVAMGSGQTICEPMLAWLRNVMFSKTQPNVEEACFMVTCAMEHVIDVNPGGVGGEICIATLQRQQDGKNKTVSARLLSKEELDQHHNRVAEFRGLVANFLREPVAADVPVVG